MTNQIPLDPKTYRLELLRMVATIVAGANFNIGADDLVKQSKKLMYACGLVEESEKPVEEQPVATCQITVKLPCPDGKAGCFFLHSTDCGLPLPCPNHPEV